MNEAQKRSPYWLSPGIDVPTKDDLSLLPLRCPLRGCYVDRNAGEAAFVPTDDFMREIPLWRIDVLDGIMEGMRRTRTHALVAFFRECQAACSNNVPLARHIEVFRKLCQEGDIAVPDELEAMLILDQQFR